MADNRTTYPPLNKSLVPVKGSPKKSRSWLKGFAVVLAVAVVQGLIFSGLWVSQVWTKTPLVGLVVDEANLPIVDAIVTTQGKTTITDEEGRYKIENLQYGQSEIAVEAPGYNSITGVANLELRTGGEFETQLTAEVFGTIAGVVRISGEDDVDYSSIEVRINDDLIAVDNLGRFESPQLELGQVRLEIKAPEVKEYTQLLDVKQGPVDIGEVMLGIDRAKIVQVQDWYTGEAIPEAVVIVDEERYVADTEGVVELGALNSQGTSEIELRKAGYATKEVVAENNKLFNFVLPQVGELFYTSEVDGTSRIYKSNLDGSNSEALSQSGVWVTGLEVGENELFYTGWELTGDRDSFDVPVESVYRVDTGNGQETKVLQMNGISQIEGGLERQIPLLDSQQVVTLQQTANQIRVLVRSFEDTDDKPAMTIERAEGTLANIADARISPDGRFLAVLKQVQTGENTQNSIRLVSLNDDTINQQIIFDDGSLEINGMIGFTEDSQKLLFETTDNSTQILQVYTIGENTSEEFPELGINRYKTTIQDNLLYYVVGEELRTLNLSDFTESTVLGKENKINNFAMYGSGGVLIESGGKLFFYDLEQQGDPKLVLVSTNFEFLR